MPQTILVVDDDATVREVVRITLQREGYTVLVTADGFEALEVLHDGGRPDLIVLDLRMPGMDGVEFLHRVRANPELAPLRVLVLTAWADEEIRRDPILDGLTVLQKPFLKLVEAVRRELGDVA